MKVFSHVFQSQASLTLGCQAQQQQQIQSPPDKESMSGEELEDSQNIRSPGDTQKVEEPFEECVKLEERNSEEGIVEKIVETNNESDKECSDIEEVGEEGGSGDVDGRNSADQEVPTISMESFEIHQTSESEEDNLADTTLMEEDNLEDTLMEENDLVPDMMEEVGFDSNNLDEGAHQDTKERNNASLPLLLMAPFNRVFNITTSQDGKYETSEENDDEESNLDPMEDKQKVDNEISSANSSPQNQSTKSVLELLENFGLQENLVGMNSSESHIYHPETRLGRNDGRTFLRDWKFCMLLGTLYAVVLIDKVEL